MADTTLQEYKLPIHTAVTVPAVRMVYIEVYAGGEPETDHAVYPVVALVVRTSHLYSIRVSGGGSADPLPSHEKLVRRGWYYQDVLEDYDVLIVDEEFGLCRASDEVRDCDNISGRAVVCTWPPERDDEELAVEIQQLRAIANKTVGVD